MSLGQLVLVTLNNPREMFWRGMLFLTPAGLSVRGVVLLWLDDFRQLVKSGEAAGPSVVVFPIRRVQRIEDDDFHRDLPSLAEFRSKTGIEVFRLLTEPLP